MSDIVALQPGSTRRTARSGPERPRQVRIEPEATAAPVAAEGSLAAMGRRIKLARQARSLSQAQLGDVVGVSRAAISQWEAGEVEPGLTRLQRAAEHLQVDLNHLMTGTGVPPAEGGRRTRREAEADKKPTVQVETHRIAAAQSGMVAEVEVYPIDNGLLLKVRITGRLVAQLLTPV